MGLIATKGSGLKDLKIFHSNYTTGNIWKDTIHGLEELGYIVHREAKPHDKAFVLGGYWENPTAFKDPILFHRETKPLFAYEFWASILKEYYDNMIDLTNFTTEESIRCIAEYYETYQS